MRIWTVGHSTLPAEEFVALVAGHGIELLADVRRFPSSRRHPHFNRAELAAALEASGIEYRHFADLGGRRAPRPDSPNTGWREAGFRGYADYMQTVEFGNAIAQLHEAAVLRPTVIMCAEKAWQNCHRGLICDRLKIAGEEIIHIVDRAHCEIHPYTKPARTDGGMLSYAADSPFQGQLDF